MSSAYTEQDLREAREAVNPAPYKMGWIPEHLDAIAKSVAVEFSRIRSEARAGMREACAGHRIRIAHDYSISCSCGWQMSLTSSRPQGLEWEEHIRSLPDLAADEAIERIKAEARLEEGKLWDEHTDDYRGVGLTVASWKKQRIAALTAQAKESK